MTGPEASPGLQALLASLDPAARAALGAALQQGRLSQAELVQAWRACGGSPAELSRWAAGRLGSGTGTVRDVASASAMIAPTVVEAGSGSARLTASGGAATTGQVGPYVVERELARGGMGVVHVARHAKLGRRVALKVLPAGARGEEAERFQLEAQAAARLKHPNIVGVHEVGVHGEQPWLAMDLIEGESLQARLGRAGPLPEEEAASVVEKVARAVAFAHKAGVLHRDIKPHNVLLDGQGEPFLADFGLAKDVSQSAKGVTVTGQVLGTPAYMPPEQAAGELELVDRRADVYSLGATLYAALTARAPYDGPTAVNVITRVLTTDPPRPSTLRPKLDRDLETVCLHAMERDAAARYPTAHALAEDLRRWREGAPITARPVGALERLWRRARRNRALTGGLAGLGAVAVAVWVAVTVQLDRSRDAALTAMDKEKQAKEAAEEAMTQEQRARAEAALANARLAVLRTLDRGAMLLSLGRHVDALALYERAGRDAEALGDSAARERLRAAARRGADEASLHLGRRVADTDGDGEGHGCAFGPRGRVLATVEAQDVVVRDLTAGRELLRARVGACEDGALAFTPDGEVLVVAVNHGGGRSTEAAWTLSDGVERWRHDRVERSTTAVVVDATGQLAAILDVAGVTTLLDPRTGQEVRPRLDGDARPGCETNHASAYAAAFAPAGLGPLLAIGYADGLVTYWDVSPGQVAERVKGATNARTAVGALAWPAPGAFVPGKVVLVVGTARGEVLVWDLQARELKDMNLAVLLAGEAGGTVRSLTFREAPPGGEPLLVATTQDGSAWLWDRELRLRRRLHTPDTDARSCAVSADGRVLATAGPKDAWLWSTGPLRIKGGGPLAFDHDARRLVLCRARRPLARQKPVTLPDGARGNVHDMGFDVVSRDLSSGDERQVELGNEYGVLDLLAMDVGPDGRVFVATREDHELFRHRRLWTWDPARREPPRVLELTQACSALAVTAGGEGVLVGRAISLATCGEERATDIQLLELPSGQVRGAFRWHVRSVTVLQLLADGGLVSVAEDRTAAWWRPGVEQPTRIVQVREGRTLPWTPPEERPALGDVDVRDLVKAAAYSPETRVLAVAFGDGTVSLWRDDGAPNDPPALHGHEHQLILCAFARGGELLVTASRDGKARVWDVPMGTALRTIEPPGGPISAAALSRDGRRLALESGRDVWVYELAR